MAGSYPRQFCFFTVRERERVAAYLIFIYVSAVNHYIFMVARVVKQILFVVVPVEFLKGTNESQSWSSHNL